MDLNRKIILRRFIRSPHSGESEIVHIEPIDNTVTTDLNFKTRGCELQAWVKDDVCFYLLNLPAQFRVVPVDWRRFAYDHKKVSELLYNCINDNFLLYGLESLNKNVLEDIEKDLLLPLKDLESVFDVIAVSCENTLESLINITVSGEHKNGELMSHYFQIPICVPE